MNNLTITCNTKEALLAAERAIIKLFWLQDGIIEALENAAEAAAELAEKLNAQHAEAKPIFEKLRASIALVDKGIDKEIDAGIDRHNAKPAASCKETP